MDRYLINQQNLSNIRQFPHQQKQAILIDFAEQTMSSNNAEKLAEHLPENYKIHFIKKPKAEVIDGFRQSLSAYLQEDVLEQLLTEFDCCLGLFEKVTSDFNPLVSFRVVTEEYVKQEHPSVSEFYHRDAASLTLTKCFYGEGAIYIDEDNVKRDFFATNSIAINDIDGVHNPDKFSVVPDDVWLLLKGEMYKGIDERNQAVFDFVLGKGAEFKDFAKGEGLIHKGGRFNRTNKRIVFTVSTYKTEF